MLTWIVIGLFWLLFVWAALSRGTVALYLFFGSFAFGTLAVVPTAMTGGVTFLPASVAVIALTISALRRRGAFDRIAQSAIQPRRFLLLTLFVGVAVASGIFFPRLFGGQVFVVPVRAGGMDGLNLLKPTSQNITQGLYLIVSLLATFVLYEMSDRPRRVFKAILFGGAVLLATGLVDEFFKGSGVLAPFRTASYALHTTQAIAGTQRIVGLMAEPASFGSLCAAMAALIYFLKQSFHIRGWQNRVSNFVVLGLIVMTVRSASSTAYVMLIVFFGVAALHALREALVTRRALSRRAVISSLSLVSVGLAVAMFLVVFMPDASGPLLSLANELLLEKTSTSSFEGRSIWNAAGMNAFFETRGIGVGLGAARTSSWPLAILSNTGVLGALLMFVFIMQLMFLRTELLDRSSRIRVQALKLTMVIIMAGLSLSATQADFGLMMATCFGAIMRWHQADVATVSNSGVKARRTIRHNSLVSAKI